MNGAKAHANSHDAALPTGYPLGVLERLQKELLHMLDIVRIICEECNLTWFADSGTCLGAVRHDGFIPWDDDVDIALPLADYLTFCEIAPQMLEGSPYGIYTPGCDDNYPPLFAKLYKRNTRFVDSFMADAGFEPGIFIDVFAYTQLDSDPATAHRQIKHASLWQRISYIRSLTHPKIPDNVRAKRLVRGGLAGAHALVRKVLSAQDIRDRFYAVFQKGDGKGRWVSMFYPTWGTYTTETLFPPIQHAFCDISIPVPADAHAYLSTHYGTYWQLPPQSERIAHVPLVLDFGDGINVMDAL